MPVEQVFQGEGGPLGCQVAGVQGGFAERATRTDTDEQQQGQQVADDRLDAGRFTRRAAEEQLSRGVGSVSTRSTGVVRVNLDVVLALVQVNSTAAVMVVSGGGLSSPLTVVGG